MNVISQQLTMPYAAQVLLYTHVAWNAGTHLSTVFNLLIKQILLVPVHRTKLFHRRTSVSCKLQILKQRIQMMPQGTSILPKTML